MPNPYIDDPQLAWYAALNGQDPTQFARTQRDNDARQQATDDQYAYRNLFGQSIGAQFGDPDGIAAAEKLKAIEQRMAQGNQNYTAQPYEDLGVDAITSANRAQAQLDPYGQALNDNYNTNQQARNAWQQGQNSAFSTANQANAGLFQGMQNAGAAANAQDQSTLSTMQGNLASSGARDAANVSQLQGLNGTMRQLQAGSYGADVQSNAGLVGQQQAAYGDFAGWSSGARDISSDAGLVGQQQGIANDFGGWASGANDISSDAGLVANQQGVYDGFGGFASGANAISSDAGLVGMQQGVYDDYGGFASGAMDLESQAAGATADAESLAAQKEALGEFRERMDPRQTDAERFLYMQSRLQQEQGQRANRDANYRELERRGMGGSTMALSNLNASSAEASNTRALQDLGANAKAVDRAEKALVNYGNMSSTIADQSFERDFSTKSAADRMAVNNNQQRLAGIAGQGQMATNMRSADDDMRRFNSEQQMQGLQGQGTMANAMRTADDAMRTGNADRRLTGLQGQGAMVSDMRNADDRMRSGNADRQLRGTEGMANQANAMRTADDAMLQFNREQSMVQSRHQDNFAASQQEQAWNRGVDISDAGFQQTAGDDRRTGLAADAGFRTSENAWNRTAETTRTGAGMNRDYMDGFDQLAGRAAEGRRDASTELGQASEFELGRGRLTADAEREARGYRETAVNQRNEDTRAEAAKRAAIEAREDQQRYDSSFENQGLLGIIGLT